MGLFSWLFRRRKKPDNNLLLSEANAKIDQLTEELASVRHSNKNLVAELDDVKDDREYYKKNHAKAKGKVDEMEGELSECMDKQRELAKMLKRAQDALSETEQDLEKKSTSLSFVQEVLTAELATSESLLEENKKIDNICNFISTDLQELCKHYFPKRDFKGVFDSGLAQWEAVARKSWIRGKKTIAFVGEFSAGKTSIVNRFLRQYNADAALLPVDPRETTPIPTYIKGDEYSAYQFYTPEGKLKDISEASFKKVTKETLKEIKGVSELIRYFVMTCPNPNLAGISILDTPGFNSIDKEDEIKTTDVINECDALVWVIDSNNGAVNNSSLKTIKEYMKRPLYVIINKTDGKAESDIAKVERQVMETFNDAGVKIERCIRFSSLTPIDELLDLFASIENDTSAEAYLVNLTRDFLPNLKKECEDELKSATNEYVESSEKCDFALRNITAKCNKIQNDSAEASSIPNSKKRGFFKKRVYYELDVLEMSQLEELLNQISNKEVECLRQEIDEFGRLMQENQIAYDKKRALQVRLNLFTDAEKKFKRLKKDLK